MKFSFSLDTVDLNTQAPNRNKRECKYYWEEEVFSLVPHVGFDTIALPYDFKWDHGRSGIPLTQRNTAIKYGDTEGFKKFLNSVGVKAVNDVQFDPSLFANGNGVSAKCNSADVYFNIFRQLAPVVINYAADMGAETATISASGTYYACSAMGLSDEEFMNRTAAVFEELAAVADARGIKLCVKNEFWSMMRGEKVLELLDRLPASVLLCVDTANLQLAGVDVCSFIERNAGRIGNVVFTDTRFVDDVEAYKQGLPEFPALRATKVFQDIGEGNIDFVAVAKALEKAGYDGWVIINNRNSYDICRGMIRARRYINENLK